MSNPPAVTFEAVLEATPPAYRNGGLAVISSLAAHGVDTIFGIPGTHNLELYRHLETCKIRAITTRHEQGSGYGADGYGQVSGKVGVVITTSGPGLTNVITAAATAYAESRPLLVISPGVPLGLERADIGLLHETKDTTGAIEHLLLWSRRARTAHGAAQAVADAFTTFASGRPGPVHIEIPLDVLEGAWNGNPAQPQRISLPVIDESVVAAAASALKNASRPMIVVGGGACHASAELRKVAELVDAPVATTINGKGALDENHPLSLGAHIRLRTIQDESRAADVVLVVGTELADSDLWEGAIAQAESGQTLETAPFVIRCDIDPDQLNKNLVGDLLVHADSRVFLQALAVALATPSAPKHGAERAASLRAASETVARDESPENAAICAAVTEALAPDAIIAGDSSQVTYFGSVHFSVSQQPHQHLYMPGFATLGYGIPAAIGAKIAAPERQVIALLGDGAAMFSIQEIMTAIELGLNIAFVIIDNGGYREIQDQMDARQMRHVGVKLARPDFALLGQAMGARGVATTRIEDLTGLLHEAFAATGPTIIALTLGEDAQPS